MLKPRDSIGKWKKEERVYSLSFVPSEASVDVDGKCRGEINSGDAEAPHERLEGPISSFVHCTHISALPAIPPSLWF